MSELPPNPRVFSYADPTTSGPARSTWRWVKWVAAGVLGFMVLSCFVLSVVRQSASGTGTTIPISEFHDHLIAGRITKVTIIGDTLYGTFGTPQVVVAPGGFSVQTTKFRSELPSGAGGSWQFIEWLLENHSNAVIAVEADTNNLWMQLIVPFIPWLLIFGFVFFMMRKFMRPLLAHRREPTKVIIVNQEAKL